MADILVQNVPTDVVRYYKALAKLHKRSFDEEITATVVEAIERESIKESKWPASKKTTK